MCLRAVTSSLCDHIDRQGRPRGLHAVSATLYLALHPHNLPLLRASLKASNTWASTLKCCYHIIENHSVFYRMRPFEAAQPVFTLSYLSCEEQLFLTLCQFLTGLRISLSLPSCPSPPLLPSVRPPLMDLADRVGHATATRGPS